MASARLEAQAGDLENEVAAAKADVIAAREPIVQDMLENLAEALLATEALAASLRARLYGFFVCSNGPQLQKLPQIAISLLRNPPQNATHPQINTPGHFKVQEEKQAFQDWKKQLESDANAMLSLD